MVLLVEIGIKNGVAIGNTVKYIYFKCHIGIGLWEEVKEFEIGFVRKSLIRGIGIKWWDNWGISCEFRLKLRGEKMAMLKRKSLLYGQSLPPIRFEGILL